MIKIEYGDIDLQHLAEKGYSDKFPNIQKETVEDICFALSDLYCATCIDDIKAAPFYAVLMKDDVYQLSLKNGWLLNVVLTIKEEDDNYIKVMSLLKKEVCYGKPA